MTQRTGLLRGAARSQGAGWRAEAGLGASVEVEKGEARGRGDGGSVRLLCPPPAQDPTPRSLPRARVKWRSPGTGGGGSAGYGGG